MFKVIDSEQTPATDIIKDVDGFIKDNRDFIEEYLEFSRELSNAIGLAANQSSYNGERVMKRMFSKRTLLSKEWSIVINPVIIEKGGMVREKTEGCLTWGTDKYVVADRHYKVTVEYYDIDGKKHTEEFKGFDAQVWQHEINHLDGVEERIESRSYEENIPLKVGNNDRCPCGSGIKFKKCCRE